MSLFRGYQGRSWELIPAMPAGETEKPALGSPLYYEHERTPGEVAVMRGIQGRARARVEFTVATEGVYLPSPCPGTPENKLTKWRLAKPATL